MGTVRKVFKRLSGVLLCLALLILSACGVAREPNDAISGLVLGPSCKQVEHLAVGESTEGYFTVITISEVFFWDVELISTDESIATVQYEKIAGDIYVYYTIQAVAVGEAYVYFTADGGKVESEKIHVTVTPPKSAETEVGESAEGEFEETVPKTEASGDDRVVYVTKSGTKYHYSEGCAGKNATEIRLGEARLTKEPCKTCVPEEERIEIAQPTESENTSDFEEETTVPADEDAIPAEDTADSKIVYVTPSGKRYHYSKSCAGNNAKETTMDEAIAAGKTPCGTCAKK